MSRQAIKDKNFRTIGYIDTMSDGKQKALDATFRTLGYFDPKRNITQDANFRTIAQGNVLAGLIYK
ncbi:hypothetical protein F8237_17070 [Bradyrhizobium betae]|uniref:Uncharacterized protein n=1 Tax=Bradyrhizobium betae TaxID=244734 RepID=A0A5P6P7I0_9BRAD|nr:hypothetical protein F8237_17070 [Bradyrhizobium betae]